MLGALLADAASLGLHWIYDPQRIAEVAAKHVGPAFVPINAQHYADVPAYFAHAKRHNGDLSQYGLTLYLAIQNMLLHEGKLNVPDYQEAFAETFAAGGSYVGYIDAPTRGTLANLSSGIKTPSGIEDDQHPAIARLPAVLALMGSRPCSTDDIRAAVEISNLGESTLAYSLVFSRLLQRVLGGLQIAEALQQTLDEIPDGDMRQKLAEALNTSESDSVIYGGTTERACHLSQGLPLSFHILSHAKSYREAVQTNILAGGDSCGRALMIGAVYGAQAGTAGLPVEWLLQLNNGYQLWQDCHTLANR